MSFFPWAREPTGTEVSLPWGQQPTVLTQTRVRKPMPCPSSCSTVGNSAKVLSAWEPGWMPYQNRVPGETHPVSTLLLNFAEISLSVLLILALRRASSRLAGYQVLARNGPAALLSEKKVGPALPSTPLPPPQGASGAKFAPTWMTSLLLSRAPHSEAAVWNRIRRCAPRVVPGLPPSGLFGVGSLKPSPGPSRFTITTTAADTGTLMAVARAHSSGVSWRFMAALRPVVRRR